MPPLVLDIETKRSFDEVGGAHNRDKLGVSLVGVYHYESDRFESYREERFEELSEALKAAETIIGFNLVGFDMPILAHELGEWVNDLPKIDLMLEAQKSLGHRVSLESIAKATLGMSKLGSGLDALHYYRTGDWDSLEKYCLEDVRLTRDLYEYAKKNGFLYCLRGKFPKRIAISFSENPFTELFKQAYLNRSSVKIRYKGTERVVDVAAFDGVTIKGYCQLRREERNFTIDNVEAAEIIPSSQPLF